MRIYYLIGLHPIALSYSHNCRLERRFLERVAQTNRVKSTGVGGGGGATAPGPEVAMAKPKTEQSTAADPPSPPWLQPPNGFQPGSHSAAFGDNRAAAAGRALLGGMGGGEAKLNRGGLSDSANLLALELQRRASQSSLLQNALHGNSSSNLFAAARQSSAGGLSNAALSQLAQNASAARLANLNSNNQSLNNLMLKTGLSRDQLSKLARDRGLSSGSLSNLLQRQNSFDALMSLDLQSLQSIDNLANLIQTNGSAHRVPEAGVKNADFVLPGAPSSGQMDSLLRNLSNNNVRSGGDSNANLNNLLQSMRSSNALNGGASSASLFGGHTQSAASLANMLRQDSSTGLSALRMQDGLTQRNSSVDDFLSLVAAGDIPHQDPTMLNIPLMQQQQQQQSADAARLLAHQQLLQGSGNSALANALASRSMGSMSGLSSNNNLSQTALAMAQARKRKLDGINGDIERQHGDN